jgi:hypothetical protein
MSLDTMSASLQDISRNLVVRQSGRGLRLALVRGELLRVPRTARRLRVLSGTAWVSLEREDAVLGRGESLVLPRGSRYEAVVSASGGDALFFELD